VSLVDDKNDDEESEDHDDDAFRRTQQTLDSPEKTFSKRMLLIEREESVNPFSSLQLLNVVVRSR
jgi:hypothetical protein